MSEYDSWEDINVALAEIGAAEIDIYTDDPWSAIKKLARAFCMLKDGLDDHCGEGVDAHV